MCFHGNHTDQLQNMNFEPYLAMCRPLHNKRLFFGSDGFCCRDLNMVNIIPVPQRFKQALAKRSARIFCTSLFRGNGLYGRSVFIEHRHEQFIQLVCACQIMTKWFFNHNAGAGFISANISLTSFFGDVRHKLWRTAR